MRSLITPCQDMPHVTIACIGVGPVGGVLARVQLVRPGARGWHVLALEMGALLEDVAGTVHAHPTITEAFHESVLKTLGHAIHTT